jgi:exopolysaccharide biosynthesis polyprenyl glycosylphosphotransferase
VASSSLHSKVQKSAGTEWAARLILGSATSASEKKARRSTGTKVLFRTAPTSTPLEGVRKSTALSTRTSPSEEEKSARLTELRSTLLGCALVIIDWLLIAEICARLHVLLPHMFVPGSAFTFWRVSHSLIGVALLHAVLINAWSRPKWVQIQNTNRRMRSQELVKAIFWATLVLNMALQLQGLNGPVAAVVWGAGILHFSVLSAVKWTKRSGHKSGLRCTQGVRNVLIVGAGATGRRIAKHIAEHPEINRSVYGFLDDRKPPGSGIIGRTAELAELARAGFVDEVILACPQDQDVMRRLLNATTQLRLDFKVAPQLFGCEPDGEFESLGNIPLISLHEENVPVAGLLFKRVMDVTAAGTALIVLAPALLLIALLIKVESSGPVLYKAPRAGRKRLPFPCYKFRTMVRNADDLKEGLRERNQRSGPFFKIPSDPRITRVGQFLRRYSLDELPQLWNVLRGEMSMVGPRPHPLDDVSSYAVEHLPRLDVTPGITGLWQVTARQDASFQTGLKLDMEYIRRWSLRMDLSILLRTAGAVLRGSGQ